MRTALNQDHARRAKLRAAARAILLTAAAAAVLAGCARRDSIKVGSVPDDYRTNHPIVVAEQEEKIDLPVGASEQGLSRIHRVAIDGFVSGYDRRTGAPISIMVPIGGANSTSASFVADELGRHMVAKGVPAGRVVTIPYDAGAPEASPPIRVTYRRVKASTGACGRWPDDILKTVDNKHYANFGCAYQNNLAAQMANPADLLGPREPGDIDAENRGNALDEYKNREISGTFRENAEVDYSF
jgi:pilus assembly protein CpaD